MTAPGRQLGLTASECAAPLIALEAEGFAMRGCFTPDATGEEWCERRLLSRIHHYTLKRLRAEIEPVATRDFLRFLFDWQHVSAAARMAGPKALDRVAAQLEGFEAPAAAWESEILKEHGASFFDELIDASGLLRSQLEEALAELVALGLITSDSFGGLRALLVPSNERRPGFNGRRRR